MMKKKLMQKGKNIGKRERKEEIRMKENIEYERRENGRKSNKEISKE